MQERMQNAGRQGDQRKDEVKQWPRISSCRRPAAVRIGKSPASTRTVSYVHARMHTYDTTCYLLVTRRRMTMARHAHMHAKPRRFVLSPLKIRRAWAKRDGIRESKALKSPTWPPRSRPENCVLRSRRLH